MGFPVQYGAMSQAIAYFDEPTDFSLVQGGPLFQLLRSAGLIQPPVGLLRRRIIAAIAIAWVPLLVLTILDGTAAGGIGVPFFFDIDAHCRILLAIPMLLVAEVIIHQRIKVVVRQFLDRGIVAPQDEQHFTDIISSAMRLRNSVAAEVIMLAVTYLMGFLVWKRHFALHVPTWIASPVAGEPRFSIAGMWYFFVSMPIVRFLSLRWLFRMWIWYRFLWQLTRRVPLQLNALHPDRAGGLGFLASSVFAYVPFLFAQTVVVSGAIGGKIWHEGATLPQFKMEIVAWVVVFMIVALAPLFFFAGRLAEARRDGLREYGILVSRGVAEFRRKWIKGERSEGSSLMECGDVQSLADLAGSFEVVQSTGLVPFGKTLVIRLAIVLALPFFPLLLTIIPLEKLIDRVINVFL